MENEIRMTKLASCAGCGAKVGAGTLARLLDGFRTHTDPRLIVGYDKSDDASVYVLDENTALVQTTDFFPPIVDDPFLFGQIAAANALSDVYAMGGEPKLALNIMCLAPGMAKETVQDILRGGYDKAYEAGAIITGGHTIQGAEPLYGLAVSGFVHPKKVLTNSGAQPGDVLLLTKPLGTGIASAGRKVGILDDAAFSPVVESMAELNRAAGEAMVAAGVHAATDVTGFGLAGHLHEMLSASACAASINWSGVPTFAETVDLARQWCRPARSFSVEDFAQPFLHVPDNQMGEDATAVLCDPQTSGGMLCAIPSEAAATFEEEFAARCGRTPAKIGRVIEGESGHIHVVE